MRCKKFYFITPVLIIFGIIFYIFLSYSITFIIFNDGPQQSHYFDFSALLQNALLQSNKQQKASEASADSTTLIQSTKYTYEYECCNPNVNYTYRKSILYQKLYKCASSTLQNILMRFGLKHELNFMLPKNNAVVISYYQPYRDDMIPADLRTSDGKYDILTHHIRYSPVIKKALPPGTVSVTLMRSIPSLFESIYYYFKTDLITGKNLQDYLKNPFDLNFIDKEAQHGLNQMSMDLGFERKDFQNETAITSFIEFIDSQFDFVMIVEYMEESLVLLAHLMGWPLDHVSNLPLNKRIDSRVKHPLTELEIEKVKQLNHVDTLLYDHFLKKFQKCREQFGIDRLQHQVNKLEELNEALAQKCVAGERTILFLDVKGYQAKNFTEWDCIYSTKYPDVFTNELKLKQSKRLKAQNQKVFWTSGEYLIL